MGVKGCHSEGWGAEDFIQFCRCLSSATGRGVVPGGHTILPSRSSHSRWKAKLGTGDLSKGLAPEKRASKLGERMVTCQGFEEKLWQNQDDLEQRRG